MTAVGLLFLVALVLSALSGAPGVLVPHAGRAGQRAALVLLTCAGVLGATGAVCVLVETHTTAGAGRAGFGPLLSDYLRADALSAFFLVPIFVVPTTSALFGLRYRPADEQPHGAGKLEFVYGWLVAGMGLVVLARHALVFLIGWEIMTLSAFFLVTTEDEDAQVRRAGWLYFVAAHACTLSLFALFALYANTTGGFAFSMLDENAGHTAVLFALAVVAFGLKAGIFPLHMWLPSAHASAPAHVSAVLSGVLIKMGVYGILRVLSVCPRPTIEWAAVLIILGIASGIIGVVYAIGQHDLKRLLAYHSIENIGIIFTGIGVGVAGAALEQPTLIVLGMGGALLHVWNHGLFKSLLFLTSGAVVRATGSRDLDTQGGLARRMPLTSLSFLCGAYAICGLPLLNGFVSEMFIYLGLVRMAQLPHPPAGVLGLLSVAGLAFMGALALACFVKVFGTVFLGTARSAAAEGATEAPGTMTGSMLFLGALCVCIGLVPILCAPILESAGSVFPWWPSGHPGIARLAQLEWLSWVGIPIAVIVGGGVLHLALRSRSAMRAPTWDCGFVETCPSMQYTASSFGAGLVGYFRPLLLVRDAVTEPRGLLAKQSTFESHALDIVLDAAVLPAFRFGSRWIARLRILQAGQVQLYILYVFLAMLLLLLWRWS